MDVIRPDATTDPATVSSDRDLPAPPSGLERDVAEEPPILPEQPIVNPENLEPAPAPVNVEHNEEPPTTEDSQPITIDDGSNVTGQPLFVPPTFQHPNLTYPTISPVLSAGPDVAQAVEQILTDPVNQLNSIRLSGDTFARTQNLGNLGARYVFNDNTAADYRARLSAPSTSPRLNQTSPAHRAAEIQSNTTPPGRGIFGVSAFTRNVVAGQPFHPITQDAIRDSVLDDSPSFGSTASRFGQGLGDIVNLAADYFKFRYNEIRQQPGQDFEDYLQQRQQQEVRRQFSENRVLRNLAADVTAGASRLLPFNEHYGEDFRRLRRNVVEGIRGPSRITKSSVINPLDAQTNPQLEAFYNQSPTFQRLIQTIEPEYDSDGVAIVNPSLGQFGDFGNAGALSALLYIANIPEGTLTGGLYELTNLIQDGTARLQGRTVNETQANTRPGLFSGILGRDLGIMQRYREGSNYLSFVNNPALSWLPKKGQWYAGFLADAALGGIADAPIDALFALRGGTARQARQLNRTLLDSDSVVKAVAPDDSVDNFVSVFERPLEVVNRQINNNVQPQPVRTSEQVRQVARQRITETIEIGDARLSAVPEFKQTIDSLDAQAAIDADALIQQTQSLVDRLVTPGGRANVAQSAENLAVVGQTIQRNLSDNYEDFVSAVIRQNETSGDYVIRNNIVVGDGSILDNNLYPLRRAQIEPTVPRLSQLADVYRSNPGANPDALDFLRRTDESLIGIAKLYGIVDADEQFVSHMRLESLRNLYPAILSRWGNRVDEEALSRPLLRLTVDEDPINLTPEMAVVPGTPPMLPATTGAVRPIELSEQTTRQNRRTLNRTLRRVNRLEPEKVGDDLIQATRDLLDVDPALTRQIMRESSPLILLGASDADLDATLDVSMRMMVEARTATGLRREFERVDQLVKQQEELLEAAPPLERAPVIPESITRAQYADGSQLEANALARQAANDTIDVTEFPELVSEVSNTSNRGDYTRKFNEYIPTDEDIETLTSALRFSVSDDGNENIAALRVMLPQYDRPTLDKIIDETRARGLIDTGNATSESGEAALRQSAMIDDTPVTDVRVSQADVEDVADTQPLVDDYVAQTYTFSSVEPADVASLPPPDDTPRARAFLNSVAERQRAQLESTGTSSVPVLRMDPEDVDELFPPGSERRARAVARFVERGAEGANDYEILVRGTQDIRSVNEFTNISPVVRQTDVETGERLGLERLGTTLEEEALSSLSLYHGTKHHLSPSSSTNTTSLSNELGLGLYATPNRELAGTYARAMPAKDSVVISPGTLRDVPEGSRVYPVVLKPDANIFDVDVSSERWREIIRNTLGTERDIDTRFRNATRPGLNKPGREYLHIVRSQYIKKYGQDGYGEHYLSFLRGLHSEVLNADIDVLRYGDTTNIVNVRQATIRPPVEDTTAKGSISEGLLSRYAADMHMHSQLNNATTKSILDDDRLDIDTRLLQHLEEATGEQERIVLDNMRQLNNLEGEALRKKLDSLQTDLDNLRVDKLDNVASRNRNIIRNQGDDCL